MGDQLSKPVSSKALDSRSSTVAKIGACSVCGLRRALEDVCILPQEGPVQKITLIGVLDGHAGREAAKFCSKEFEKGIAQLPVDHSVEDVEQMFLDVDRSLLSRTKYQSGATACLAMLSVNTPTSAGGTSSSNKKSSGLSASSAGGASLRPQVKYHLTIAHVGDSRCLLVKDGRVVFSTTDHTPKRRGEADRIQRSGGSVSSDGRVSDVLAVSRSLGDRQLKINSATNSMVDARELIVTAVPDVVKLEFLEGTYDFMLIVCDGLLECLSDADLAAFVDESLQSRQACTSATLATIAGELCDRALEAGTTDNMSAIIVQLSPDRTVRGSEWSSKFTFQPSQIQPEDHRDADFIKAYENFGELYAVSLEEQLTKSGSPRSADAVRTAVVGKGGSLGVGGIGSATREPSVGKPSSTRYEPPVTNVPRNRASEPLGGSQSRNVDPYTSTYTSTPPSSSSSSTRRLSVGSSSFTASAPVSNGGGVDSRPRPGENATAAAAFRNASSISFDYDSPRKLTDTRLSNGSNRSDGSSSADSILGRNSNRMGSIADSRRKASETSVDHTFASTVSVSPAERRSFGTGSGLNSSGSGPVKGVHPTASASTGYTYTTSEPLSQTSGYVPSGKQTYAPTSTIMPNSKATGRLSSATSASSDRVSPSYDAYDVYTDTVVRRSQSSSKAAVAPYASSTYTDIVPNPSDRHSHTRSHSVGPSSTTPAYPRPGADSSVGSSLRSSDYKSMTPIEPDLRPSVSGRGSAVRGIGTSSSSIAPDRGDVSSRYRSMSSALGSSSQAGLSYDYAAAATRKPKTSSLDVADINGGKRRPGSRLY